jgi:ankyrin repeat protein
MKRKLGSKQKVNLINKILDGRDWDSLRKMALKLNIHEELPSTIDEKEVKISILNYCISEGNESAVSILLGKGRINNLNKKDSSGNYPIHYAVKSNNCDIVKLLIINGADVNVKNQEGFSPLHIAVDSESFAICKTLIKSGSNINTTDSKIQTPLHYACSKGDLKVVELLLTHSKRPEEDNNVQDMLGSTALHIAVEKRHAKIVEKLLEYRVNVNLTDLRKETALHKAIKAQHSKDQQKALKLVKILLPAYEFNEKDNRLKEQLLKLATKNNYLEVREELEKVFTVEANKVCSSQANETLPEGDQAIVALETSTCANKRTHEEIESSKREESDEESTSSSENIPLYPDDHGKPVTSRNFYKKLRKESDSDELESNDLDYENSLLVTSPTMDDEVAILEATSYEELQVNPNAGKIQLNILSSATNSSNISNSVTQYSQGQSSLSSSDHKITSQNTEKGNELNSQIEKDALLDLNQPYAEHDGYEDNCCSPESIAINTVQGQPVNESFSNARFDLNNEQAEQNSQISIFGINILAEDASASMLDLNEGDIVNYKTLENNTDMADRMEHETVSPLLIFGVEVPIEENMELSGLDLGL